LCTTKLNARDLGNTPYKHGAPAALGAPDINAKHRQNLLTLGPGIGKRASPARDERMHLPSLLGLDRGYILETPALKRWAIVHA
jgi:hypothetical protein